MDPEGRRKGEDRMGKLERRLDQLPDWAKPLVGAAVAKVTRWVASERIRHEEQTKPELAELRRGFKQLGRRVTAKLPKWGSRE